MSESRWLKTNRSDGGSPVYVCRSCGTTTSKVPLPEDCVPGGLLKVGGRQIAFPCRLWPMDPKDYDASHHMKEEDDCTFIGTVLVGNREIKVAAPISAEMAEELEAVSTEVKLVRAEAARKEEQRQIAARLAEEQQAAEQRSTDLRHLGGGLPSQPSLGGAAGVAVGSQGSVALQPGQIIGRQGGGIMSMGIGDVELRPGKTLAEGMEEMERRAQDQQRQLMTQQGMLGQMMGRAYSKEMAKAVDDEAARLAVQSSTSQIITELEEGCELTVGSNDADKEIGTARRFLGGLFGKESGLGKSK